MALILIMDGEYPLRHSLALELRRIGHECIEAGTAEEARELLKKQSPTLLLLDLEIAESEAQSSAPGSSPTGLVSTEPPLANTSELGLLASLAAELPETPIIATTAYATIDSAVAAMKHGAAEYLEKPLDFEEVALVVERVLRNAQNNFAAEAYRRNAEHASIEDRVIGSSPEITNLLNTIRRLSEAPLQRAHELPTVLLQGETGTGKDLLARHVHRSGPLSREPFVQVNCSGLPRELVESELFGHEKGAFTGATQRKQGLFEVAAGGTIFLDEIGDMPMELQSKLLGVLENRRFRRVGGTREYLAEVRIIAATNKDLPEEVKLGRFRSDLYFRLKLIHLQVPPLRERAIDIPELSQHFLDRFQRKYRRSDLVLDAAAIAHLSGWHWPGNVRELAHCIEHVVLMSPPNKLRLPEFADPGHGVEPASESGLEHAGNLTTGAGSSHGEPEHSQNSRISPAEFDFSAGSCTLENISKRLATEALEYTGGNVSEVARILDISRGALRNRLRKWGIGNN